MHPRPRQKHHTPYRWNACGTHKHFQSSLSNPLVGPGPITRSRARTRPKETIYLTWHSACNTQKNLQDLLANARYLIGARWNFMVILRIPAHPHLNNKTRPGRCHNLQPRFAARVKVNKARRAIHTNADNSCFCYSSQQFNETWCDQIKKQRCVRELHPRYV